MPTAGMTRRALTGGLPEHKPLSARLRITGCSCDSHVVPDIDILGDRKVGPGRACARTDGAPDKTAPGWRLILVCNFSFFILRMPL